MARSSGQHDASGRQRTKRGCDANLSGGSQTRLVAASWPRVSRVADGRSRASRRVHLTAAGQAEPGGNETSIRIAYLTAAAPPTVVEQDALFGLEGIGLRPTEARSTSELEQILSAADCGGWLCVSDRGAEPIDAVLARARRFRGKLTLIWGSLDQLSAALPQKTISEDAPLLICLAGVENLSREIRARLALNRWRELRGALRAAVCRDMCGLTTQIRAAMVQLFDSREGLAKEGPATSASKERKRRLNSELEKRGFGSAARIRRALSAGLLHGCVQCGLTSAAATSLHGSSESASARTRTLRVLNVRTEEDLRSLSTEEMCRRMMSFISLPSAVSRVPALAPTEFDPLIKWAVEQSRVERHVRTRLGAFPDDETARSFHKQYYPYITALLRRHLGEGEGLNRAISLVLERALQWLAHSWPERKLTGGAARDAAIKKEISRIANQIVPNVRRVVRREAARCVPVATFGSEERLFGSRDWDPAQEMDDDAALALVEELLDQLDPRNVALFLAHAVDGETQAAVAARFGVAQSSVSQAVARVRRELRSAVERRTGGSSKGRPD